MISKLHRLVLSISSKCNLSCKYCYVYNNQHQTPMYHNFTIMKPKMARVIIQQVYDLYKKVYMIQFFGGEPNYSLKTMQAAVNEAKCICIRRNLQFPEFSVITNLTILNEKILSFYKNITKRVSVSFDGPKRIHDKLRQTKAGKGTHDIIVHNLKRLNVEMIPFTLECTFTKKHIEMGITVKDLLKYFEKFKATRVDIIPVMVSRNSEFYVYGENLSNLIQQFIEAIDYWFDYFQEGGESIFGWIAEIFSTLTNPEAPINFCPAGSSYLAITPNGEIYPCHLFIGNKKYLLGTVGSKENRLDSGIAERNIIRKNGSCVICLNNINYSNFHCVGKNEFYTGDWKRTFKPDCIFKRAIMDRIIDKLPNLVLNNNKNISTFFEN